MRFAAAALTVSFLVLVGCSGSNVGSACPKGSTSGAAPTCVISATCVAAHTGVMLDCSAGGGKCVCSENGVVGATVDYQDAFCHGANGATLTVDEDALSAANSACGWKL